MADSNTPAPDAAPTIAPLDMDWARDELVPFLQSVFAQPSRSANDWQRDILFARHNIHLIPFYEDFPLTIECLRLTLLNSETLTPRELSKFMKVTEQGSQMCIRIFVRHASRHGPYQLFSLGRDPNPDFPRGNQARTVRPARTQPLPPTLAPQTSAPAGPQASTPSISYAQLADENAALRRQMDALNLEAKGRRGGRDVPTGRPPQPRRGYNGRSDRSHHSNQGPRTSQAMQQTTPQYPPAPFGGYNQPYGGPYGMQQHHPQQSYGGWNGNQSYHNAQQANSSQSGASSAYKMPPPQTTLVPQQVRGPGRQGQPAQHHRGASAGQQGQALAQYQDPSAPLQGQASVLRRPSSSVLHPEARPFTPGSNTTNG